jgi:effector-binding domain-containing protein
MIEPIRIEQTAQQTVAMIRLMVPRAEMPHLVDPALRELYSAIAAQAITPMGPWLTWHVRRPSETFDFAIAVPIRTAIAPHGRVQPGELPAVRVARTVYHGDYSGLGPAWGEFMQAIADASLLPADDLWEQYQAGPDSGLPPSAWRTELTRPLREP